MHTKEVHDVHDRDPLVVCRSATLVIPGLLGATWLDAGLAVNPGSAASCAPPVSRRANRSRNGTGSSGGW